MAFIKWLMFRSLKISVLQKTKIFREKLSQAVFRDAKPDGAVRENPKKRCPCESKIFNNQAIYSGFK
ncbi:hypothetical protein [Methylomonas sp. YC3]